MAVLRVTRLLGTIAPLPRGPTASFSTLFERSEAKVVPLCAIFFVFWKVVTNFKLEFLGSQAVPELGSEWTSSRRFWWEIEMRLSLLKTQHLNYCWNPREISNLSRNSKLRNFDEFCVVFFKFWNLPFQFHVKKFQNSDVFIVSLWFDEKSPENLFTFLQSLLLWFHEKNWTEILWIEFLRDFIDPGNTNDEMKSNAPKNSRKRKVTLTSKSNAILSEN